MSDHSFAPFYLDVTFCSGKSFLRIIPNGFDLHPRRGDPGVVYIQVQFETPLCKGQVFDALTPESLDSLCNTLTTITSLPPRDFAIGGLDGCFDLELEWDTEEDVAVFKASMPHRLRRGDWSLWHEASHYRGSMLTRIELEFWLKASDLEGPVGELKAIIEHMRLLRARYGPWEP